ncbi:uncharacterized protein LOC127802391 isoform X2 [Diospyros lotus]|uniref:uncharacterized protein LOC127802391 isoform X2 n=1 Tax=Diospyros lotus TaxID=55363 RepID=UPI0022516123|nr:uncharacterized protein LOC127802391 isoform X2 [Diospyros lotus]
MEMKWNSNHQRDDDDGSEVPNRESKRRCSLADVDGDPIREHELETKLEAMMKRVGVLEKKLESFHHSSSSVDGDAMRQRELETKLEAMVKRVEELEEKLASFHHSSSRSSFDPSQRRGFQLHFDGKLLATTYTYSGIESEDSKPVKIVIYDASNKIISSGPLSSMKVGIVPLDGDFGANDQGDWTEQEFNAKIVHAREGKKPLVTGELEIILRNGVGEIKNVSFTDNSSWIRSRRFRLGARAVSSIPNEVRVREARSEPFMVKDQRGEPYKKHHPPNLGDEIWRLEKISKDGVSYKSLSKNGITTIEHFLRSYYMDRSSLRKSLGRISDKQWKTITEHATACVPDDKLYTYHREGETLLFNSVFKVVGVSFDGQYYHSLDELDAVYKDWVEKMASLAYKNINDFVQLDPLLFPSLPSNQLADPLLFPPLPSNQLADPLLFPSLPSNQLADPFANPSASLEHSNFAGLNQDMHQFHQPALDRLESSQQKEAARKESQPHSAPIPYSEEVEEWEIPLPWQSKRARVDEEGTSATGTTTEPTFGDLSDWSTPDFSHFFEEGVPPDMPLPFIPRTYAPLEARRQAEKEPEAQKAQAQSKRSRVPRVTLPPKRGQIRVRLPWQLVKKIRFGLRLIYPTVKPRDEQDFLRNTSKALNTAEQCRIEGIQRQVMATTNTRADLAKGRTNVQKLIQDGLRLQDELRHLEGKVGDLEDYRDKTLGHERDTNGIRGEWKSLENEVRQLKGKLEEQQKIEAAFHEANASVIKEHNRALEEKNHLETQLQEGKGKVEKLARQLGEMDIGTIRAEAVKEF